MQMIKNFLIAAALTMNKYLAPQDQGVLQDTFETEREPVKQLDEWQKWMHHDDVTQEEIDMLNSDDPELILQAKTEIEIRQEEFNAFWSDPEAKREAFWDGEMPEYDPNKEQTPMHLREGWEDDDDLPETFIGYDESGNLSEVKFDDLPEWRNGLPTENTQN